MYLSSKINIYFFYSGSGSGGGGRGGGAGGGGDRYGGNTSNYGTGYQSQGYGGGGRGGSFGGNSGGGMMNGGGRSKDKFGGENLRKPRWESERLQHFEKNFYVPNPVVLNRYKFNNLM